MKKLVFSISLILSYTFMAIAGVVKSIPAKADELTSGNIVTISPPNDANEYEFGLQFMEYLRQGGSVDFSNTSDNYTVDEFIDDFNDIVDGLCSDLPSPLDDIFSNDRTKVQLTPNNKLKNKIGIMRSNLPSLQSEDNNISVNPNPDYTQYLDIINGTGFFFKDWNNGYRNNVYNPDTGNYYTYYFQKYFPNYNYSWFIARNNNQFDTTGDNGALVCCGPIYDVNIYSIGDNLYQYSITPTIYSDSFSYQNEVGYYYKTGQIATNWSAWDFTGNTIFGTTQSNLNGDWNGSLTGQGSLTGIFTNVITKKCRNVNIFVDGVAWSIVGQTQHYNVELGTGTYLQGTNQSLEYKFDIQVYFDLDDLIDKIDLAIDNKVTVDFPDISDLIVDSNGQQTIAVTVFQEDYTIDDQYIKDYGAMIPVFPLWVTYPVSLENINTVATVGIVDVIPDDIIEILGIFLIVGLFVFLCHRLME